MNNNKNNNENFFEDFLNEMEAASLQSQGNMSIIEFANRIIFNNDPDFSLFPTQKAILKAFYKEPLNDEELNILKGWVDEDRSTWVKDRKYISLVVEAGRRASKALNINTLIATKEGFTKLEDVHIGDYVYNNKGKFTKVINETFILNNKKCYRLKFSNNEKVECSFDHLWLTKSKNETKFSVKTTEEIINTINLNHCIDEYKVLINKNGSIIPSNKTKRFIVNFKNILPVKVKCLEVEDDSHVFLITKSLIPTHNCNSESAIISTTEGDLTYKELHKRLNNNEKIGINTYDFKSNIFNSYTTYDLKTELNAVEQTYIVETRTGKTEITNEEHPFLTWTSKNGLPYWKKLKDLKVGDYVACSQVVPIFGKEKKDKDYLKELALCITGQKSSLNIKNVTFQNYASLDKEHLHYFLLQILQNPAPFWAGNQNPRTGSDTDVRLTMNLYVKHKEHLEHLIKQFLKFGVRFNKRSYHFLNMQITSHFIKLIDVFGLDIYKGKEYMGFLYSQKLRNIYYSKVYKNKIKNPKIESYTNFPFLKEKPSEDRKALLTKAKATKNNILKEWIINDCIEWEKIKSIEPYKVEQTIALEVADTNIIGSAIISHNSTMASIICLKEFYDLIIEDNPQKKFGLIDASPISILVMAQSQAQVKETIFSAIKGYANNSRYFTSLANKKEIEILTEEIRCASKNVSIYAKHTNSKSLVGYTLKCMVLDEVSRFESVGEDGKNKAFEIWENVACHKEDNLIYTELGATTFKQLLEKENKEKILTYDLKTGEQYYTSDYKIFNNNIQNVYNITTKTGRTTDVTKEHPLLVWNKDMLQPSWVKQEDLKIGDTVAISSNNNTFKSTNTYHPSLSKLLGYLVSDGNITKLKDCNSCRIRFINKNDEIIYDFNKHLKTWNNKFYLKSKKDCNYKYDIARLDNKTTNDLISWLKEIGIAGHNALTKYIPLYIFSASKTEASNFIAGLYLGDGSVPNFKNQNKIHIEYNSISKKLIQQLQELLLKFKILSYISNTTHISKIGNYPCYKLIISDSNSILNFYNEIPLLSYKQSNLKSKLDILNKRNKYQKNILNYLPIGLKKYILSLNINKPSYYGSSFCGKHLNNHRLTFNKASDLNINEISQWLTGNILWDTITDIKHIGQFNTIGLSVNKTNIIGNSFITHNTGGSTFGYDFKKVAISSAWEPNDPIEVLYNRAAKDPNTLGFKLTTFQVNLKLIKGVTPVVVSDYINDFVKARREYEGIRFTKFNCFIDKENLTKSATGISIIDAHPCEIDTPISNGIAHYAGINITRLAPSLPEEAMSFIHVDPALKKDSAALAIARPIQVDNKWKIQIDGIIKWEPHTDNKGIKRIVSFIDIENKINEIIKIRKVNRVTMDQWNSQSIIQNLQAKGIDAAVISCTRESQFAYFTLFKDLLSHDYIILPKDSLWTNNLITELSELVLKANRQIVHPTAGKDLADAIVNAVYQCHQHMLRTGINLQIGMGANLINSQGLAPLQKVNIGSNNPKSSLQIGSAIDRLYNARKRIIK